MNHIIELSERTQKRAHEIIRDTKLIEIWESVGATVNVIGSLKMGLMMKHRDIDMHVYTDSLTITESFSAIAKLAEHPSIKRVEYTNLLDFEDKCLEWHAWYEGANGELWQIDMMHILRGSQYDGYFENVAERILAALTDETRNAILRLKYETPDDEKIMGIEYYRAVIEGGIRTYREFKEWRKSNPATGIIEWVP